jgi:uncharacterized membrane protein
MGMYFFPLTIPFILLFFLILAALVVMIEIGIIGYAYEKAGVNSRYILILLFLSLIGSYINIPILEIPGEQFIENKVVSFFGMKYVIPTIVSTGRTVIAINVGGAVVPILISLYLLIKNLHLLVQIGIAVLIMTVVVHWMARPVPGVGIAVPIFLPPLLAALLAYLLAPQNAPPVAYIAGSLGSLIGADLLNLDIIPRLGAPIASIGGAGRFDGVFLTGIIAVLLA